MKEVVVVGSVNRNSISVVHRVVNDLVKSDHRVWISEGFKCKQSDRIVPVAGKGNIAKRLPKSLLSERFYVCVLPYHGDMVTHELDCLKAFKVIKFMGVYASDTSIHDMKLRDLRTSSSGCDPLSKRRCDLEAGYDID